MFIELWNVWLRINQNCLTRNIVKFFFFFYFFIDNAFRTSQWSSRSAMLHRIPACIMRLGSETISHVSRWMHRDGTSRSSDGKFMMFLCSKFFVLLYHFTKSVTSVSSMVWGEFNHPPPDAPFCEFNINSCPVSASGMYFLHGLPIVTMNKS